MTALEDYVTHLAKRSKEIHVVTGTAYLPDDEGRVTYKTIGRNKVSVPTHFYKVWVRLDANGRLSMEAFKLPNNGDVKLNSPLAPFRISIKSDLPNLERSVGLIFLIESTEKRLRNLVTFSWDLSTGQETQAWRVANRRLVHT